MNSVTEVKGEDLMSTLYHNATVLTMDATVGAVDALLVEGGRFVAVGDEALVRGRSATRIDLEGRTVVPGMIDAHTHVETGALALQRWIDIRDNDVPAALEIIRARMRGIPAGEWIVVQATFDDEWLSRAALDGIAPDNPVVVRVSMHVQIANTVALRLAGLFENKHDRDGTVVMRRRGGEPTGVLLEAFHLFPIPMPPEGELSDIIARSLREQFNRYGVTSVYEVPLGLEGMHAFQALERAGRLTARVALTPAVMPGLHPVLASIEQWSTFGLKSGFGSDMLWLGGAKFFLDGAGDAAFKVLRDIDHPGRWGALTHRFSEITNIVLTAFESDIHLWIHALGPDAQKLALDAVIEARYRFPGEPKVGVRIEHIGNDHFDWGLIAHMREAKVTPVPTAGFIHVDDGSGIWPFRTLLEEGFRPPANSDNAGTQPFATNPWFGIGKMRTRTTKRGVKLGYEDEQVQVLDAIRMYTEFGAIVGTKADSLGTITPGKLADFAVLTEDPLQVADEELESIESVLTVVGGKEVWSA